MNDLDLHGNSALWDTAADMVAERLSDRELDMVIDGNNLIFTDPELSQLIQVCESRIPFDPTMAPTDQQWTLQSFDNLDDLVARFEYGNWAARTAFRYQDLYFVERISAGDEWLSVKRDGEQWCVFDSISFEHMAERNGVEHCQDYIDSLANTPVWELMQNPTPTIGPAASKLEIREELLEQIAQKHCDVETLAIQKNDSLDFHDVSVWGLKSALEAAYRAGAEAGMVQAITPQQDANEPEPAREPDLTLDM